MRATRFFLVCFGIVLVANWLLFGTSRTQALLAPDSTTAAFEQGFRRVDAASTDPKRDVLVLGDSRIFSGFDDATARANGGLRFINAGVAGTTPRCWAVFARALDPSASRYRAVVVPVDTYSDDDGAIGSIDGNDRAFDLHYIVLRASLPDIWTVSLSFPTLEGKLASLFELLLRGPLLREDLQNFLIDPLGRMAALRAPDKNDPKLRDGSLRGLRVDFRRDVVEPPPGYAKAGGDDLDRQILHRPAPSPSYAAYRREWLGAIVERYDRQGVPVIFVRIPTRPAHRTGPPPASGSLVEFALRERAVLLPERPYVALELPDLFVDADHLNAAGARAFSALLGHDVAVTLARGERAEVAGTSAKGVLPITAQAGNVAPHRFPLLARTLRFLSIGVPIRFQSYEFFVFLCLVAALFYAVRSGNGRRALLLGASWYFYARWNAWYLAVLLGLTITDYVAALLVERTKAAVARRAVVACGLFANLAFLATAKYADFFTGTVAHALHLPTDPWALHLLVPVGISFHTFQSISYLVDVYRGRLRATRSFVDYALYLAFFPQLLAGPIVRAGLFFRELTRRLVAPRPRNHDIVAGAWQILLGLVKKSVVADRFAVVSDLYFLAPTAHPGALAAWSGAFAFAMQIYFDFAGYSDIAIGSARILGFRFPLNFRRPYLAWSITEFWRRWHMTLSRWLRDYLYIPLGGSRHGLAATIRNLMLTMLLGGLWHGANWTFIAWGGYHGLLLAAERVFNVRRVSLRLRRNPYLRPLSTVGTFLLVLFGWVLFRAQSFSDAFAVAHAMLRGGSGPALVDAPQLALAAIAFSFESWAELGRPTVWRGSFAGRAVVAAMLLLVLELGSYPGQAAQFIYFKF